MVSMSHWLTLFNLPLQVMPKFKSASTMPKEFSERLLLVQKKKQVERLNGTRKTTMSVSMNRETWR